MEHLSEHDISGRPWHSFERGRAHPRDPDQIAAVLLAHGFEEGLVGDVRAALFEITRAIRREFPENLFADLDYLAVSMIREAQKSERPTKHISAAAANIVVLQQLFGSGGPIRFRYVHDFLYGYDWARWVAKDPAARAHVGPFDLVFLERMNQRGTELINLISEDDEKYPRLRDEKHRNPFGFSREPDHEMALHRALAESGEIPVEAWRVDATPRWDRPYMALRRERAAALGLSTG